MIDEKKIEEAATKYAESQYDNYDIHASTAAFKAGIDWFKKNLWHDVKEQPKVDELLIVQYIKERKVKYMMYCWDLIYDSWAETAKGFCITKWCYLKDLI